MKSRNILPIGAGLVLTMSSILFFQNCAQSNQIDSRDLNAKSQSSATSADPFVLRHSGPLNPGDYVYRMFLTVLQRAPQPAEQSAWDTYVVGQGYSCSNVSQIFTTCDEYHALIAKVNFTDALQHLYQGLYGRTPTAAEVGAANPNLATQATAMIGSAEFKAYCSQFGNMVP